MSASLEAKEERVIIQFNMATSTSNLQRRNGTANTNTNMNLFQRILEHESSFTCRQAFLWVVLLLGLFHLYTFRSTITLFSPHDTEYKQQQLQIQQQQQQHPSNNNNNSPPQYWPMPPSHHLDVASLGGVAALDSNHFDSGENKPNPRCLGLGLDHEMDKLLAKYNQVFVLMPAKVAGTTIKRFTKGCMGAEKRSFWEIDNIVRTERDQKKNKKYNRPDYIMDAFAKSLQLPSLIASHVDSGEQFIEVIKAATTKETLIVYVHREETERLRSAISQVANRMCLQKRNKQETCVLQQKKLHRKIEKQHREIGVDVFSILTCDLYEAVRDNAPNLVALDFHEVSKLLELLAKHHCPGHDATLRANTKVGKPPIAVELEKNDDSSSTSSNDANSNNHTSVVVSLEDYLTAKMQLMEYAFLLKNTATCQSTTRELEGNLASCPDGTLHLSSSNFFRDLV